MAAPTSNQDPPEIKRVEAGSDKILDDSNSPTGYGNDKSVDSDGTKITAVSETAAETTTRSSSDGNGDKPLPSNGGGTSGEVELPGRGIKPPGGEIKPSGDEIKPPGDEIKPPGDEIKPPGDEIKPPGDKIKPPGDEIKPPGDEIKPPGDEIKPPGDEIKPSGGDIEPPSGEAEDSNGEARLSNTEAEASNAQTECKRQPSTDNTRQPSFTERYRARWVSLFRKYILEIVFMLYMFPMMLLMTPMADVFIQKACLYNLGYNVTICSHLDDYTEYKRQVEVVSNRYSTMRSIVSTVPGAIASLVAGQYMSRYGLRLPLMIAMVGAALTNVVHLFTFYRMSVPLYVNVIAELPAALTGGVIVILTAVFTHITMTCAVEQRQYRFLAIQFFMFVPLVIAIAIGGILYSSIGIFQMTLVSTFTLIKPLLLIRFYFKDIEISDEAKQDTCGSVIRHSMGLDVLKRSCWYFVKARPVHARAQLHSMFICLLIGSTALSGSGDLNYYYMNLLFKWDVAKFTRFESIGLVAVALLSVPNMLLFGKVLRLREPVTVAVGFSFLCAKYLLMSAACFSFYLYFAQMVVGLPFIVAMIAIRSHMSVLVEPHEVSVIFALASAFERLVPIGSSSLTMIIYNLSIDFFPGLVYAVQGAIAVVPVGLAILCAIWTSRYGLPDYSTLVQEDDVIQDKSNILTNA